MAKVANRTLLTAALAAVTLALAACGGGSDSGSSAVPPAASSASTDLFADAPVADAAAILPGSTMEKIKKRGKLVVAEALDAPLLSQQDPSNPDNVTGFDADLAKALAIYILGKPSVEIVPPATETREALLGNGTVDVVFNTYTITEERAKQVAFAGPYFSSGLAVAVKTGNTEIKSIDDLAGKTVIVGANTPAVTEIPKRVPTAKVIQFGTDPQAVQALTQGRGDAYVQDITLLASNAASNKDITVVGNPFTSEPYGIGLKHGDSQMKQFVNTWLTTIQKEGLWADIWKASLGTVVKSEAPEPPAIGSVPGS
ncbi:glutamate ABC transporter substrate-binding protein [Cryptosporangium aurantiacum]|uniref:Glutamate transport system substrate-binding protein n=1 Tax=Cryptosporangium aurantiacum TaxID=134849 RepID=A0A1M7TXX9_9ACTN|nr:glutamate ABC transporter substrate-binding protein [Cryptosporangium aurantiacum]SHN75550.1 glutamate transport system substrate-binding protein [Cryptosporangium aurantiacum]